MSRFEITQLVLLLGPFFLGFYTMFHWLFNPEMTLMQLTIKFWWVVVIMIVGWGIAVYREDKNNVIFNIPEIFIFI